MRYLLAADTDINTLGSSPSSASLVDEKNAVSAAVQYLNASLGVGAVLVMVTISGYTAIYFESMLKKAEKISIWERNFQLAFYSILFLIGMLVWEKTNAVSSSSLSTSLSSSSSSSSSSASFSGWSVTAVIITCLQAAGGLLVAATLKYADAILKTLATCGSIVLSALVGYFFLGGSLDLFIVMGCCATILAICNYTLDNSIV